MDNFNLYSHYYDALYKNKKYENEADYVAQLIKTYHSSANAVIELGCGTGNHAAHLSKKGFAITGIERSEQMVQLARSKGIDRFEPMVADITNYSIPQSFDVAISLFHVVSYLTSNADLSACFNNTHAHLNSGGLFIFDVWYSPAVYFQKPETRIKRLATSDLAITRLAEPVIHFNKNVVDVNYEIIIRHKEDSTMDILNEQHPMRHFSIPEIELLASSTGFKFLKAEEFGTGNEPGSNTWGVCFILKKLDKNESSSC